MTSILHAGAREGHEPHRHLATELIKALLNVGEHFLRANKPAAMLRLRTRLLLPCLPDLVHPIRLALNTFEPHLVGHMLTLVQRLLKSHPAAGKILAPSFGKWLPAVSVFWGRHESVMLPPPVCLPATASRDGARRLCCFLALPCCAASSARMRTKPHALQRGSLMQCLLNADAVRM